MCVYVLVCICLYVSVFMCADLAEDAATEVLIRKVHLPHAHAIVLDQAVHTHRLCRCREYVPLSPRAVAGRVYVCMYVCMYACVYVCMCIYICVCVCVWVCMYVCMCVCVCVYASVCVCACVCVNVCMWPY
jgi:hypothetical protein